VVQALVKAVLDVFIGVHVVARVPKLLHDTVVVLVLLVLLLSYRNTTQGLEASDVSFEELGALIETKQVLLDQGDGLLKVLDKHKVCDVVDDSGLIESHCVSVLG